MVSNSNSMLSMRIIFSTWYFSSEATASNMASRTCAKMSSFCVGAAHRASSERVSAPPPSLVVLCWWRSCFAPLFQLQRRRRGRLLFVRVCMRRRSCPQGTVVLHKTEQNRAGQARTGDVSKSGPLASLHSNATCCPALHTFRSCCCFCLFVHGGFKLCLGPEGIKRNRFGFTFSQLVCVCTCCSEPQQH